MKEAKKTIQKVEESPHNSRRISALVSLLGNLLLWISLGGFLSINAIALLAQGPRVSLVNDILLHPLDPTNHITLANLLWQNRKNDDAQNEITIAHSLQSMTGTSASVLGETSEDLLRSWDKQNKDTEKAYAFWQTVVARKPDYRDAYITLMTLAAELGKTEDAKYYYFEVKKLDPNAPLSPMIKTALGIE